MKKTIKLTENKFHNLIKESVKKILREYQFDNDIDYNSIYEQALDLLSGGGEPSGYGWRDVAEAMGFRLDSLGPNDMETMKDAIEDAMMDTSGLANEAKLRGFVRETVKKMLREYDENSQGGDGDFRHDYRTAAKGYVNGSVNMPDPKLGPNDNAYIGDTDSNKMHKDLTDLNKKHNKNQKAADKRWQKAADSRPLHRKNSLNRG